MQNLEIKIKVKFCQLDELTAADQELVACAIAATRNSYANYSHFHVGAALRLYDGRVVTGANQENAAFPLGLCAERTAIFAAQANYPDQSVEALAIAAANDQGLTAVPVTPCGACRQVGLEVEDRYKSSIRILLYGTKGVYVVSSMHDLVPLSFSDGIMR